MNLDILTQEELTQLTNLINQSQNIIICTHKSPDGDAMGSAIAWANHLAAKGKNVRIAIPDACPDFLQWLPGTAQTVVRYDKRQEEVNTLFDKADLVFCLDFNTPARVDEMQHTLIQAKAPKVLIDHHLSPDMPGAALVISRPEMCSTCELVFRIIHQAGEYHTVTRQCATALYCGMMTDTGAFTYNSSRPEIFMIIGLLLEKGIDKDEIYNRVNHNCSSWCIRLRGYIMFSKLNVLDDMHASYFALTREEMARFKFVKGDAEGLVNEPLRIKGMKLSISLREDTLKDNLVWVSLRSSCGFHCREMAERFFNGGGHADAAGGKLTCTMQQAEQTVREAIAAFATQLR